MKLARHYAAICLIAFTATLVGCDGDDPGSIRDIFARDEPQVDTTVKILKVHVTVVEVPIGSASESTILWGLLNRQVLAVDEEIALADNGLQIGVGPKEDWSRLEDVLVDLSGLQREPMTITTVPDLPVPIVVAEHTDRQTIFLVHTDDTVSGMDYPPGSYVLSMLFALDPDGRSLTVTALPQVETTRRRPMIVTDMGTAAIVNRPTVFNVYPLMFQTRMSKGDFMVIGTSDRAKRSTSIGRAYMVTERDGVPVERVLVITPQIVTREVE